MDEDEIQVPLASAAQHDENDSDLDASGVIAADVKRSASARPSSPRRSTLRSLFYALWRRLPSSWSGERDPSAALEQLAVLASFIALFVFVFALPGILQKISPDAPTPPGTAPQLDAGASLIYGEHGAVASENGECSKLGVRVMRDMKGNAIDAMVSTLLCQGVVAPFASGLGGGALILVHFRGNATKASETTFLDAREVAPSMTLKKTSVLGEAATEQGGDVVAVPGELLGIEQAHRTYGRLPWKDVVEPVVEIARQATVSPMLARRIAEANETILRSPSLSQVFTRREGSGSPRGADPSISPPTTDGASGSGPASESGPADVDNSKDDALAAAELPSRSLSNVRTLSFGKESPQSLPVPPTLQLGRQMVSLKQNATKVVLLREGDKLLNPVLVDTLSGIAENGSSHLYGKLGAGMAQEVQGAGGTLSHADLKSYRVVRRSALESYYHGLKVLGAPPPSSGGASIAMALNILEGLEFRRHGRNAPTYLQLVETLKYVFAAKTPLGDPGFAKSTRSALRKMLSKRLAMSIRARIEYGSRSTQSPGQYSSNELTQIGNRDGGTTHVSIVDEDGNAVSASSSINSAFGAGFMSPSTGVVYNDNMRGFAVEVGRRSGEFDAASVQHKNTAEPGKRPVTPMSPTIVLHNGQPFLVAGASGGPHAVSAVLQTILNVVDWGDMLGDAISAPRLHHQLVPNTLYMESIVLDTCELFRPLERPSGPAAGGSWSYWPSVCRAMKEAKHNVTGPDLDGAVHAAMLLNARVSGKAGTGNDPPSRGSTDGLTSSEPAAGTRVVRRVYASSDPRRIGLASAY